MRAFVAISLPDEVRAELSALQDHLRTGRAVPEENLHLTLCFLDDQPEQVLERIHSALGDAEIPALSLTLSGLELFGGKSPRILYIRAEGGKELSRLQKRVRQIVLESGVELPRKRFRPHVTLARFRRDLHPEQAAQIGAFLEAYGNATLPVFSPTHVGLYSSVLHEDGAIHEELAQYPIGAA